MIYCVVPQVLEDELYDKLVDYYRDDDNVKVIIDRRESERRTTGSGSGNKRERRDRRRPRVPGEFPDLVGSGA